MAEACPANAAIATGLVKSGASVQNIGDVPIPNQCFKLCARAGIDVEGDARVDAAITDNLRHNSEISIPRIG